MPEFRVELGLAQIGPVCPLGRFKRESNLYVGVGWEIWAQR